MRPSPPAAAARTVVAAAAARPPPPSGRGRRARRRRGRGFPGVLWRSFRTLSPPLNLKARFSDDVHSALASEFTSLQREAIYIVTCLDDDDDDDNEDDSEMDLGSSSYSSDLEKRVLGKSMSGGMDGSCRELRDENHEIRLAQLHVQITHPPSPCKSPSRE